VLLAITFYSFRPVVSAIRLILVVVSSTLHTLIAGMGAEASVLSVEGPRPGAVRMEMTLFHSLHRT
jgi:hypothetical protein